MKKFLIMMTYYILLKSLKKNICINIIIKQLICTKYTNNYTSICIRIRVIILYYLNTIYDMQNEKNYLNYCNEFEHIQDFEIVF